MLKYIYWNTKTFNKYKLKLFLPSLWITSRWCRACRQTNCKCCQILTWCSPDLYPKFVCTWYRPNPTDRWQQCPGEENSRERHNQNRCIWQIGFRYVVSQYFCPWNKCQIYYVYLYCISVNRNTLRGVKLTNIWKWRIPANRKAKTAMEKLNTSFCNGLRMPNLVRNGKRTELKDKINNKANNGWTVCIWSGLISQSMLSILPFISVACNVQREPCKVIYGLELLIIVHVKIFNCVMYKKYVKCKTYKLKMSCTNLCIYGFLTYIVVLLYIFTISIYYCCILLYLLFVKRPKNWKSRV